MCFGGKKTFLKRAALSYYKSVTKKSKCELPSIVIIQNPFTLFLFRRYHKNALLPNTKKNSNKTLADTPEFRGVWVAFLSTFDTNIKE